jgi:hypothetical protein
MQTALIINDDDDDDDANNNNNDYTAVIKDNYDSDSHMVGDNLPTAPGK